MARTYLTLGWKYKHRLVRNVVAEELKDELAWVHLPRYVWVTEFSLPGDEDDFNPCRPRVRAHVVIDATGSKHDDPVRLTHVPGIIIGHSFDPDLPSQPTIISLRVLDEDAPYLAKVRGWRDFDVCSLPAEPGGHGTD